MASADSAIKGVATLLQALAKLITDRDVHLVIVGKPAAGHRAAGRASCPWPTGSRSPTGLRRPGVVRAAGQRRRSPWCPRCTRGSRCPRSSTWPPGTPLVASRTGALPEVTGDAAVLGCAGGKPRSSAAVLRTLLRLPAPSAAALGGPRPAPGRERFAWPAVARATAAQYREALGGLAAPLGRPAAARTCQSACRTPGRRRADRRLSPVPGPARRPGARPGLRRRAARVRGATGAARNVVAFDLDPGELGPVTGMLAAMREAGEAARRAGAMAVARRRHRHAVRRRGVRPGDRG